MPQMTGAQAALAALRANGVTTLFGIPGVHTLPLYDAIRNQPGIRHILARHEQGAGFMAEGYARITGKPGVACVITGPGVTNVATPMASAYADSIPLLVLATSLPRAVRARPSGDLHELKNQFGVMQSLAGWSRAVDSVEEIPAAIHDAFRAMHRGRPRGAYLEIPLDLLAASADIDIQTPVAGTAALPDAAKIATIARLLTEAERPLIVAGAGVTAAAANEGLARLAQRLQAPVLLGAKSRDALPTAFPLCLAVSGYGIPEAMHDFVRRHDAALVIGSKLGDQRTGHGKLPLPRRLAQIDLDPAELGLRYPATVTLEADAAVAIDALLEALGDFQVERRYLLDEIGAVQGEIATAAGSGYGTDLDFLAAVRQALPSNGIVVSDMTSLGYASADVFPVHAPRSFIHSSELCTIGCGLPLALGAKAAAPDRPVVALCGDGGFLLNPGELATAVQEKLGVVVVLCNDATYTAVKNAQHNRFESRYIATDLRAPDYVMMAQAFGADGVRVSNPEALREALADALAADRPALIEVTMPARQW
jgi:thiamine pyrophosphate-dependent acetolactate synthase large subunit-like protein